MAASLNEYNRYLDANECHPYLDEIERLNREMRRLNREIGRLRQHNDRLRQRNDKLQDDLDDCLPYLRRAQKKKYRRLTSKKGENPDLPILEKGGRRRRRRRRRRRTRR